MMKDILIRFSDETQAEIERRVLRGEFSDASELIAAAVRYYAEAAPRLRMGALRREGNRVQPSGYRFLTGSSLSSPTPALSSISTSWMLYRFFRGLRKFSFLPSYPPR